MSVIKLWLFPAIMVIANVQATEKIHKWVDKQGNIHYSSKKPGNIITEQITLKKHETIEPSNTAKLDKNHTQNNTTQEKLDEYSKRDKKARKIAANKRNQCKKAKQKLSAFKKGISYRISVPKTNGYRYPTRGERNKMEKRNQQIITRHQSKISQACKK